MNNVYLRIVCLGLITLVLTACGNKPLQLEMPDTTPEAQTAVDQ
jgi:predicted small lipoprotein YifL